MARLHKGILGGASGIIGNLMMTSTPRRSTIKARSFPKDKFKRRWNLLKSSLTSDLTISYINIAASEKTNWNNSAPAGMTGEEYYIVLNLDRLLSMEADFTNGSQLLNNPTHTTLNMFAYGSFDLQFVAFMIPVGSPYFIGVGNHRMRVRYYRDPANFTAVSHVISIMPGTFMRLPLDPVLLAASTYVALAPNRTSPNRHFQAYLTGIKNPTNFGS